MPSPGSSAAAEPTWPSCAPSSARKLAWREENIMTTLTRREFLKTSGALVVSFTVPPVTEALAQVSAGKPPLVPTELDSWVAVLPDGRVQAFFGKMDMGQSLEVAIAQIVADELDVACDKVDVLMGDTGTSCNQGGASGSLGISHGARPLRGAAAEARRLLLESGSKRLGVPAEQLRVEDGTILSQDGRKVAYSELVGGKYFHHQVEWNKQVGNFMDIKVQAKPKTPQEYRLVGKSFARRDVAWKVYGTDEFVTDVRVKGMLHARVIRPPRAACQVRGVDESSIKSIRGARVVREKDFVAVVAPREWDAVRAAQMLKVEWHALDGAFPTMDSLHEHIRGAKVVKREEPVKKGDLAAAFSAPRSEERRVGKECRSRCDWSSDVYSSDLLSDDGFAARAHPRCQSREARGAREEGRPGSGVQRAEIGRASCRERV